ncbi:S8 family serine peptidase [Cellulomonas sp. URHB0016]
MSRRPLLAAVTAVALSVSTAFVGVQAASGAPPSDGPQAGSSAKLDPAVVAKLSNDVATAKGDITAFVQLDAKSGTEVTAAGGSPAAVQDAAQDAEALAADVVPQELTAASAESAEPKRIGTTTNLVAGTLVTGDAAQVQELAASPDVVAVYRVVPKKATNAHSAEFVRALATWQDTGVTGEGVRIGVIDTGLDYTHADFGGPGTVEAYQQAYGEDGSDPVQPGLFDPTKFIGGYDFAGPLYDASGDEPGSTTVPAPDENPIDAVYLSGNSGHGTHVSGTATGFGVLPDGTTFRGDYSSLTDVSDWQVGPGMAPGAQLYSLKVFGDIGGSTNLTAMALDRAADPNGDGDFSDRLDILNLSLGSDGSPADDPDNLLIDQLSTLGTAVAVASGNAGDVTDIGGSPGNAQSAITVANSVGDPQTHDGIEVTAAADPSLLGLHAGQNSVNYGGPDVTAPVAFVGARFSGCTAFTATQAAAVAGKIAYLWWDDNDSTRACGSATRFNNAAAAGAVGVLLPTESTVFPAGIAGNATIPGAQMTAPVTDALLPEIEAGTLTVHIGPSLAGAVVESVTGDALNPSSSRGVHGSLGWSKVDVAAPGTEIFSAASGTGNEPNKLSGTSMATPLVAGVAALVRSAHPSWDQVEVKAAVVNTATHDVFTGPNQTGDVYGPQRVGSGRVDALDAVSTNVVAFNSESPRLTSVSFGVVDVGTTPVVQKKTVTVKNYGTASQRFTTSVTTATTAGGASITATPASFTLAAGRTQLVTLTLTADPANLQRDLDPTSEAVQSGVPREYVAEVAGRLVLTSGSQELRVPVHAAPRLVSDLHAGAVEFTDPSDDTAPLELDGTGVAAGGWYSLTTPLILGATSPKLEDSPGLQTSESVRKSGDIRFVGWASTAPQVAAGGGDPADGLLGIGIATDGNWASLAGGGSSNSTFLPVIDIDVDGDGAYDLETVVQKLSDSEDITVAATFDYDTGKTLATELVNEFAGDVESGIFDNSVLVAPIPVGLFPEGSTPTIHTWTFSGYAEDPSNVLDQADDFTVDPYAPPFWFENDIQGTFSTLGSGDTAIPVHKGAGAADGKLLVFQHANADPGTRAQVVDVTVPVATETSTMLDVSGTPAVGKKLTLTATVTPSEATGSVTFLDGTTELATVPVKKGQATTKVELGGGSHTLSAVFTPDSPWYLGSTSNVVTIDVAKSTSTTKLRLSRTSVTYGTAVSATVTVKGATAAPAGAVEIREGSTVVATGTLTVTGLSGTAVVALPRTLATGTHHLTAVFPGTADVAGSQGTASLRISKATSHVVLSTPSWTVAAGSRPVVTVKVTGDSTGAPAPTGSVRVLLGIRVVGTVPLHDGVATLTLPAVHSTTVLTAIYSGDPNHYPGAMGRTLKVQ